MYGRWIKGGFILAILLLSLVSLSTATCPWFVKNELYTAQCGVEKVVTADKGILANDPAGSYVVDPDSIDIDDKYGELAVLEDGSFTYDPSPDIQSGTYVIFKYTANNGECNARYQGIAKIQVSCKCRPHPVDLSYCEPVELSEIIEDIEAQAGCWGCGDTTPVFDFSQLEDGPGVFYYTLKCPGCSIATGKITIVEACDALAPPIEVCEGEVTLAQLQEMIEEVADCVGDNCDTAPELDLTGVNVDGNGFVTGGFYTATCGKGTDCESSDTGIITVIVKCVADAPDIEVCEGEVNLDQLKAMIDGMASCSGDACEMAVSTAGVELDDNGFVNGGSYEVCCTVAGTECAPSCDKGTITVIEKCIVDAPDIEVCEGEVNLDQLKAMINSEASCSGDACEMAVSTAGVTLDGNGFVTGGSYEVCCTVAGTECAPSCDTGTITVIEKCIVDAPDIEVCEGEVDLDELTAMIDGMASCSGACEMAVITTGVTVDGNGFVTGGSYEVCCTVAGTECAPSCDKGTITVIKKCEVEALDFPVECNTLEDLWVIGFPASCSCGLDPEIDDTNIEVGDDGYVSGGYYTACCTIVGPDGTPCTSCADGLIVATPCVLPCPCQAVAEDIEVCLGELTRDQLKTKILDEGYAACDDLGFGIPCDATPMVDVSTVTIDCQGKVTGGYYTVTCQEAFPCIATTDTGIVTTVPCCECSANAPCVCIKLYGICYDWHQFTYAEILAAVKAAGIKICGDDCSESSATISYTIPPGYGWDENLDIPYTLTCTKEGCTGSTDTGELKFRKYSCCGVCSSCSGGY